MLWISGCFLAVGVVVFLAVFVFGESSGLHSPISKQAAQSAPKEVKAKPDPKAYKVARTFMETAVLRKNLDTAYPLVDHELKGGLTKKQWETGHIPVDPYPAGNIKTAGFEVVWSYKTQLMLLVDLVAKKGSGSNIRPHLPFWLGLVRAHNKPNGKWLVNYWVPDYTPPVQCGPNC